MTLCIAWIRKVGNAEELMMASDSRLGGGESWDSCQKVFPLVRGDSAMGFCGETQFAFPMMHQVTNAVQAYPKLASRAMDLTDAKGHIARVVTSMRRHVYDLPSKGKAELPKVTFLIGGYSWKNTRFYIWELYYNPRDKEFQAKHQKTIMGNACAVILDGASEHLTMNVVRKRIFDCMARAGKARGSGMDMEPLEVLREIILNKEDRSIGGSIQVVKVGRHMNAMPYCIKWNEGDKQTITLFGRPLLGYENIPLLVMDSSTFKTETFAEAIKDRGLNWDDGSLSD